QLRPKLAQGPDREGHVLQRVVGDDDVRDRVGDVADVREALDPQAGGVLARDRVDLDTEPAGAGQVPKQEATSAAEVENGVVGSDDACELVGVDAPPEHAWPALPGEVGGALVPEVVIGGPVGRYVGHKQVISAGTAPQVLIGGAARYPRAR